MENNNQVQAINAEKTLSFQRKHHCERTNQSGCSTPDMIPTVNVPLSVLAGLALLAGVGMSTSCEKIKPEPTPIENIEQDSLSVSPVMKELGDMVALLGLTSVSESGGSSNTIKTAKWHDGVGQGTVFATLNEKESTKNKLVYDRRIADDLGYDYYYREVFVIKDNNITKTFFTKKGSSQKPDANTVWTKQYTKILEKKADGIYLKYDYSDDFSGVYLPDSYNSLTFKNLSSEREYKMSNIEIVRR